MVAKLYQYQFEKREGLILQYNDGWGEIAPLPGFSQETLEEAKAEIIAILPSLDTAEPKLPSVRFGVASAKTPFSLAPLKVPLCAFGSPERDNTSLKIKVGHLTVREAIILTNQYKSTHRLRVDCNKKWSLDEALFFASHFQPHDFDYLEEPVQTFSELIEFSKKSSFPIAVDESALHTSVDQIPTLKAVVVKPMLLGSIPDFTVPTVLSSTYETSLGHLLIARQAPLNSLPIGLGTFRLTTDSILQPPLQHANGFLTWEPSNHPINTSQLCLIASAP